MIHDTSTSTSATSKTRNLRAHKKSRQGCRNCKLRAVKCDETKPTCKRCHNYGVVCNYSKNSPDLELSSNSSFSVNIFSGTPPTSDASSTSGSSSTNDSASTTISSPRSDIKIPQSIAPSLKQGLAASLESHVPYELQDTDFELLHRFQTRTISTVIASRGLPAYRSSILKYAYSHPCLLHAVLSLTLLHDQHFSSTPNPALSIDEAHHFGQALSLYSKEIASPITPASRDALWATAAFLGVLSITRVDARTAKDIWPYAPPSLLDLNWLGMGEGKKAIWGNGKAFAEESDFRILATGQQGNFQPGLLYGTDHGLKALPSDFLSYLGLDDGADLIANPYYSSVYTLAQTWTISHPVSIFMNWLFYISTMEKRHRRLLEQKDPGALLLLAYWYRVVAASRHWYVMRRAYFECESICLYLHREYSHDKALRRLLQFPRNIWTLMDGTPTRSASEAYFDTSWCNFMDATLSNGPTSSLWATTTI